VTGSRVLVALRVGAPLERTFDAFTGEIGEWWQPNRLFQFTDRTDGRLAFEPEPPERLVEIGPDGERFEIGDVRVWDPPRRVVFGWRQATFAPDQSTEVAVRFEPVDTGTLVTVEHFGWDTVPQEHAARHGFPLDAFQHRQAEWWQVLLRSLRDHVTS
jgi:Activator of Hsp90 ATPase homolog 1-like protein